MRAPVALVMATLSMSWWSPACSFLDLDKFDGAPCRVDTDCERATLSRGDDPSRCKEFVCNQDSGFCEPALAAGEELFDGNDNDCDGWIDEGATLDPPEETGQVAMPDPQQVSYASTDVETYVATVNTRGNEGWRVSDEAEAAGSLEYKADEGGPSPNFRQASMAPVDDGLVFATISSAGCSKGIVHVGISASGDDPFTDWLGGPGGGDRGDPNFLYCGVGEPVAGDTAEGDCVARVCDGPGASEPAIAAIDSDADGVQALAAWLAHPLGEAAACAESSFPVQMLGAFESPLQGWLNATDLGMPQTLGDTSSLSAPALLSGSGASNFGKYLVAFACADTMGICVSEVEVESEVRGTARVTHETRIDSDEPPGHVVAQPAAGADQRSGLVGLAWREGCGIETTLRFAILNWSDTGPEQGRLLETPLGAGKIVDGPQLLYIKGGFAASKHPGGWLVLWIEDRTDDQQLMAARVTAAGDRVIEVRSITSGSINAVFPLPPGSSASGSLTRYGLFTDAWALAVGDVVQM